MGTITGGISWWDVVKLFLDVSLVYVVLYALFVVIMLLAVMNIITGIFVSDAVERVSMDRDMVSEAETERNAHHIKVLRDLFYEIDKDGSNSITLDELMHMLQAEEVHTVMKMLDLEVSDAVSFFKILDVDESSRVEIDEFVMGCMRHMGKAKAVDIETLIRENRRMMKHSTNEYLRIERSLEIIERKVRSISSAKRDLDGTFTVMERRIQQTIRRDVEHLENTIGELYHFLSTTQHQTTKKGNVVSQHFHEMRSFPVVWRLPHKIRWTCFLR